MDEFQEDFVDALDRHDMIRVAEIEEDNEGLTSEDTWTLTSEREHPETGESVEVESPYYFNMTGFGYHQDVLRPMLGWLEEEVQTDVVAGVNTGGNSLVSALGGFATANNTEYSFVPVRKSSGDERYTGLKRLGLPDDVEIQGETVAIIDDVGTTGNTVAQLHELLEDGGADVSAWYLGVDRMEGLQPNAENHGAEAYALVDARDALDILHSRAQISDSEYREAVEYTQDPMDWNLDRGFI